MILYYIWSPTSRCYRSAALIEKSIIFSQYIYTRAEQHNYLRAIFFYFQFFSLLLAVVYYIIVSGVLYSHHTRITYTRAQSVIKDKKQLLLAARSQ